MQAHLLSLLMQSSSSLLFYSCHAIFMLKQGIRELAYSTWAGWPTRHSAKKVIWPVTRGLAKSLLLSLPSNHMTVSSKSVAIPTTIYDPGHATRNSKPVCTHFGKNQYEVYLSSFFAYIVCGRRKPSIITIQELGMTVQSMPAEQVIMTG